MLIIVLIPTNKLKTLLACGRNRTCYLWFACPGIILPVAGSIRTVVKQNFQVS